jgi:hypothetical protein
MLVLQVLGMFDCVTSTVFLKVIQETCTPVRVRSPSPHSDTEDVNVETTNQTGSCEQMPEGFPTMLNYLSNVLHTLDLKDQPEVLKAIIQTLVQVMSSMYISGANGLIPSHYNDNISMVALVILQGPLHGFGGLCGVGAIT